MVALIALLGAAGGCTKKDENSRPSAVPPLDPAAAAAAAAAAPPPTRPAPALAPTAAAAPQPAPPQAAAAGGSITGSIVLARSVAKVRPKGGTLYLVARRISDNPNARGTLIAVKKLPATSFPLPFSLTAADMPFQTGAFDGELTLSARIDQDGDPLTHQKGDIIGEIPKIKVGARGVKLALNQVQKETESLAGGAPIMGQMGGQMAGQMAGQMGGPPAGAGELPPGHPALPPGHPALPPEHP